MSKTSKILKGKFPTEELTLDQQVRIVNAAGDKLAERLAEGKPIDERANNLFLWLGGLNKDVQLYACQYLFNVKKLEIDADEKTEARLAYMEPHFEYGGHGYVADTFQTIDHRPWPVEYLDGTTYEERLTALWKENVEEIAPLLPTTDTILNGADKKHIEDVSIAYAATSAVCYALREIKDDFKQPKNSVAYQAFHEKVDNTFGWLLAQHPEVTIMGVRTLLVLFMIKFDYKLITNWEEFAGLYKDLVIENPSM